MIIDKDIEGILTHRCSRAGIDQELVQKVLLPKEKCRTPANALPSLECDIFGVAIKAC